MALEEERQAKLLALLTGVTYKDKGKERSELKLTEVEEGQTSEVRKRLAHMKREAHRAEVLMQEEVKEREQKGKARLEVCSVCCAVVNHSGLNLSSHLTMFPTHARVYP